MAKRSADKVVEAIRSKIGDSGALTYEELGSFFGSDLDIELVDDVYCGLADAGIEVLDKKTKEAKRKKDAKKRTKAQPRLRFDDPVRMYLREMGQVKLLDREGEVEICKRIESAEDMTYSAIFESLTTMKRLSSLAEKLRGEKLRLDRVVKIDRKKKNASGKEERRRVVNRMEKIVKLDVERRELEGKLKKAKPQHATQTRKAIDRRVKSLTTETRRLQLHPSQVTRMSARIGELVDLFLDGVDDHRVTVTEAGHGGAAGSVDIALAGLVEDVDAVARDGKGQDFVGIAVKYVVHVRLMLPGRDGLRAGLPFPCQ